MSFEKTSSWAIVVAPKNAAIKDKINWWECNPIPTTEKNSCLFYKTFKSRNYCNKLECSSPVITNTPVTNVIKLFTVQITNVPSKLKCLSLTSLPNQIKFWQARQEPTRVTHQWTLGLIHKHQTRLECLAKDKHSSLLQTFINYRRKMTYNVEHSSNICRQG
jgi:hypothetical protein